MAQDIVKLYISLLSEFFKLSDPVVMSSPSMKDSVPLQIPSNSHSLSTAHYLMKILGELQETINELNTLEISSEVSSSLKSLLESVQWRFADLLVNNWLRGESRPRVFDCPCISVTLLLDAKYFYYLEAWVLSPSEVSATLHLEQMELFQRHMTTVAFRLAGGVDPSATSASKFAKQNPIPQALTAKVVKAFFDALYALVDGLVILASSKSSTFAGKTLINEVGKPVGLNPLELLDLQNPV